VTDISSKNLINTNVLIYFTPHPPLPLKGGGEGGGDVTSFMSFVLVGELSKWTERDVMTLNSAAKRLQIRPKRDLDLTERMRMLSEALP
jgi:hypothetical protein